MHAACRGHAIEAGQPIGEHLRARTQVLPTDKLDTLDKWRPPSLRKGTFKGVQDELLAMLAGT